MVRGALFVLLVLIASLGRAETLELQLRSPQGEWGKPLRGHLVYQGEAEQLAVDYGPWLPWVVVDLDYQEYVEDAQGRPIIRQALRLYPRQTGRWQLPSLQAGDADSSPLWVDIAAPVIDGHGIQVDYQYPEGSVWTREARRLSLSVVTDDPEVQVLADLPALGQQQALFTPLSSQRELIRDGQGEHLVFHFSWWVQANAAGPLKVEPPLLRYHKHGRDVRRLYLPLLEIDARAVPEYIPPTTPVGRPVFSSRIIEEGDALSWQLQVTSPAPLVTGLPGLERQLARLSGGSPGTITPDYDLVIDSEGARSVVTYQVPLPRWLMPGFIATSVQLRYFDPQTGRLSQLDHDLPLRWHWPGWIDWAAILLLVLTLWWPMQRCVLGLASLLRRHNLVRAIGACETPQQLRRLLLDAFQQQTLEGWAGMQDLGAVQTRPNELAGGLNRACFGTQAGADSIDLAMLKRMGEWIAWRSPL